MSIFTDVGENIIHEINEQAKVPNTWQRLGERCVRKYNRYVSSLLGVLSEDQNKTARELSITQQERGNLPISSRVRGSEYLTLWYLAMSGALDRAVNSSNEGNNQSGEKSDMTFLISKQIMQLMSKKNKEDRLFQNAYTPSIGIEVEYKFSHIPNFILDRLRGVMLGKEILNKTDGGEQWDKAAELEAVQQDSASYRYYRETDSTIGEIAVKPSASPSTQLREILHLIQSDIITGKRLFIHLNIGGANLDLQHLEPMIATSLIAGTGYSSLEMEDEVGIMEKHTKISSADRESWYFPFHRKRGGLFPPTPYKQNMAGVLEYRGNCEYSHFGNLVRSIDSQFWLNTAIIARQKMDGDPQNADQVTARLAQIWDECENSWIKLLEERNIDMKLAESVETATDLAFGKISTPKGSFPTPYTDAIGKIIYQSQHDPDLRKGAREILIKTRAEVKKIILGDEFKQG